ncbi:hypothetical protein Acsp06_65330 [Actinomycetospora sp. NBRC 106375]|uniref:hypothetical protein n=1 Tax=Actinomycetospora sp. NBRC 106375 TaxID=3032207 RepID=UPI0024A1A42B|nr:hypothetical protein [Actinomycetospora sp. NBRC 106375]GLZ50348.1 hypothetical protein Acsp06_65330 [Actinomycetospora sp. NBRC 106375]
MLTVRRLDVNLDGVPVRGPDGPLRVPVVAIVDSVTWVEGKGLVRHDGKSEAALRVVPLPRFAADLLRERLVLPGEDNWLLFPAVGRDGRITYRYPSYVRFPR